MTNQMLDILMVADPRFAGGTSAALIADVEAFLALGARIGLMFVHSDYLSETDDQPNQAVLDLLERTGVEPVPPGGVTRAGTAFLHHPLVFFHGTRERARIIADQAVLVAHHTPFRGDGSLEYDPLLTTFRIWRAFGIHALWAPISGLCRHQLESFAPLISLTSEDWINIFDPANWVPKRRIFEEPGLVIGRHGRVDFLKWPETAASIAASLPAGPGRRIRIMGCPVDHLRHLGVDMTNWEIVPFGAEPVARFVDSLDVFVYFHHPRLVESFGRTVAEAALMGRVCVLDPVFEQTFGEIAFYCSKDDVSGLLDRLCASPVEARAQGARARRLALARYGRSSVKERWHRLQADRGTRERAGGAAEPPLRTLRRVAGLYRRRARAEQ